jgi:hypothetical protein
MPFLSWAERAWPGAPLPECLEPVSSRRAGIERHNSAEGIPHSPRTTLERRGRFPRKCAEPSDRNAVGNEVHLDLMT